jgi:predicted esterase
VKFLDGRVEGAGTSAAVYFRFSAALDESSLPKDAAGSLDRAAGAYLVDITPGSPSYGQATPILASFHAEEGQFIGPNWLALRPLPGLPLREGTTYAAILSRRLRGALGETVERDADFSRLLSDAEPSEEPYRSAWARYAPLRAYLSLRGGAGDVVGATVFTTQKATGIMAELRSAVYAQGPTPMPRDLTYLRDHDGLCSIYVGKFDSPNFQDGDPPYLYSGGGLHRNAEGRPAPARVEALRFGVSVPNAEMPKDGWPVIIYAHGTGGDYLSFMREALDVRAALIETPGEEPVRMAMIGIDQVLHGPRDPSHGDPEITFFNMTNLEAARENVKQGAVDDFQLLRLVENFAVDSAPGPKARPIRFDKKRIYFAGHSQGGLTGPLFVAAEPKVKAAVMSGAGSVLTLSLLNKREPTDVAALVEALLQEPATPDHPLLNLLQAYFESSDPNNYGPLMFRRPPPGMQPKSIFQTLGVTDNYTPNPNIAAFALSLGVQPVGPHLYNIEGLELTGMSWGERPVQNNVADGRATGVLHQYTQAPGSDGHFVIFDLWAGRHDWTRFLASHAKTGVAALK